MPTRDWSNFGLTDPPKNGDTNPIGYADWQTSCLWVILHKLTDVQSCYTRIQESGCGKWKSHRALLLIIGAGVGAIGGAGAAKLMPIIVSLF